MKFMNRYFLQVMLQYYEFTSVMMSVRMGIYGPGFSKGHWLIPLSCESLCTFKFHFVYFEYPASRIFGYPAGWYLVS